MQASLRPPRGLAQLGPCSRILEVYWETDNNVPRGKGRRKHLFLPRVKVAMVISGELLVSVRSGPPAEPPGLGRGPAGAAERRFSEGRRLAREEGPRGAPPERRGVGE